MATNSRETPVRNVKGVLSETELTRMVASGAVARESGEPPQIRQTTIELHAGSVAWFCLRGSRDRRHAMASGDLVVGPGEIVSLVTEEKLVLPNNVTGVIFPRGRLLSLGLLSMTAHVDYGFHGHLRVIFCNVGPNTIRIPQGLDVARLQLAFMSSPGTSVHVGVNQDLKNAHHQSDFLVVDGPADPAALRAPAAAEQVGLVAELQAELATTQRRVARLQMGILVALVAVMLAALVMVFVFRAKEIVQFVNSQFGASLVGGLLVVGLASGFTAVARRRRGRGIDAAEEET